MDIPKVGGSKIRTPEQKQRAVIKPGPLPMNEIRFSPLAKIWTVIVLVGVTLAVLLHVAEVLPPFIWAAVTAFIFNDLLTALTNRTKQPRWIWVTVVYLTFFGIIALLLFTAIPSISRQVRQFVGDVPAMRQELDQYLATNEVINVAGIQVSSDSVRDILNNFLDRIPEIFKGAGPELLKGTFHIAIDFLVYLIVTLYLMLIGNRIIFGFTNTLPLRYRGEVNHLMLRIDTVLGAYIKGQFILITIMSVASFIVLTIMQVRYSLFLALMVGVLELIPFIGPYLAITICTAVTFFQPEHAFGLDPAISAVVIIVALFILRQLEDYLVIPNVIGRLVEIHPLLVIFTIIVASALLGPMGLLLGVPVVAALKILVGYLYYKLVDADREKIALPEGADFQQLLSIITSQPDRRLLIGLGDSAAYLQEEENIKALNFQTLSNRVDLAFQCGDEKTCHNLRYYGFSTVDIPQEKFMVSPGQFN